MAPEWRRSLAEPEWSRKGDDRIRPPFGDLLTEVERKRMRVAAKALRTAGAAGVSAHRERYPCAIRPPPCRPELAVIGPHPRSSISSGGNRQITIGPVRMVLLVANQPIKDLEPKLGFILTPVGRDRELGEKPAQPPALCAAGQQEAGLRPQPIRATPSAVS
jgi:hypothetical protein